MSSHRIVYGDIHNHNAHGYGVGSIERSPERHRIDGFRRLTDTWPRAQFLAREVAKIRKIAASVGATAN